MRLDSEHTQNNKITFSQQINDRLAKRHGFFIKDNFLSLCRIHFYKGRVSYISSPFRTQKMTMICMFQGHGTRFILIKYECECDDVVSVELSLLT